jgi:CheB methylesterase
VARSALKPHNERHCSDRSFRRRGLALLRRIVAALPTPCLGSIFIVQNVGNRPSVLPSLLTSSSRLTAAFPADGTPIEAGHIYVAPPDHHMLLEPARGQRASPSSRHVRRHRSRCCRDPHRLRAGWRTLSRHRAAAAFPGITDNAKAQECTRTIAGWQPLPAPVPCDAVPIAPKSDHVGEFWIG